MKCLNEPLSRLANRQDDARGESFQERFKSVWRRTGDQDSEIEK
jgi:hypothetical protein